jgi:CRP-like cAMP-binding protein
MERKLVHAVLSNTDLFRGIADRHIADLSAQCWRLDAKRSQDIATKDSRLPGVYALAYGTVKLVLRHGPDGQRVVRLVKAGQTFGEATALLGCPASFEAMAVTACRLVIVPTAAILGLVERDPRAARQAIFTLARRNLELLEEIESSSMRGSAERLVAYLASLDGPGDRHAGNGARTVQLPATKTLIASRLDMKKETLSRLLRRLVSQGLIEVAGGSITLLDPERLGQLGWKTRSLTP